MENGIESPFMEELSPKSFFSIEKYLHFELFKEAVFVWEALCRLPSYLKKQKLGKIEVDIPKEACLADTAQISIGHGTIIEPGVYIQGPCWIGPNNVLRHGAYIRGDVVTGEGCIIGHDTEIKNSILLNRSYAPHFNYVGDSILGNDVNLGAGVKLANFRLDHQEISVLFKGKKIPTGLKKFGAIIGDGGQLGCNVVTNPGTLIGPQVFCYPCLNIGGIIPPQKTIKR